MNEITKKAEISETLELAVRRAQTLLTEGDLDRAKIVAESVYVRAKTEAEFARKHRAAAHLIDKARRLMADALIIEATSLAAIADRIDSMQLNNVVQKRGRPEKNSSAALKLSDVNMDKRELLKARRYRDYESSAPGAISRAIEQQFNSGRMPTRAAILRQAPAASDPRSKVPALVTGVNMGALCWYELDAVIRQHEEALGALRRIRDHAVPEDVNLKVRDIIGPQRLAALIAGGGL